MNGSYQQIENPQVAAFTTADQRHRDEQCSYDALIGAVANDEFAGNGFR